MILTEEQKDIITRYFKYYCGGKQIKNSIKMVVLFVCYLIFVGYVFIYNSDKLNIVQSMFYAFGVILCLPVLFKEIISLTQMLHYFSDTYLKNNMVWEEGRIKHLELGKLGTRVTVTDEIGDPYIAVYAEELVSDLYEDDLPKEISGCLVYLKGRKKESITAYPYKYLENEEN